jgi:drug/metabolite transporter superfamily protein YnfA
VTINVSKSAAAAVEWSATGQLTIGSTVFTITFDDTSGEKRFTASMEETDQPLSFSDIANEFNIDLSGVPSELIPALTGVSLTYDFNSSTAVLTASTVHTETVLLTLPGQNSGPRVYAALLGVNVSVSLSDLPLIGQKLAAIENMGVEGMQLLVTSGTLTQQEVADLNKLIPAAPPGLPTLPPQALDKGLMLAIPLVLGNNRATSLAIQFGGSQGQQQMTTKALAEATDSSSVPRAAWLNVEKSFGPVNIKRVGLTYQEQKVWLMLDASFLISALSIGLDGLSLGFTLAMPPAISPALHGLSISYQGGPVQISGGFLEITNSDGSIEYDGEALISAEAFMLAAIGSYSTINNEPSLFIFAMLDAPLGGPSFFFVTGLAAGFGFNRDLLIPTLDKLPVFPLVAAAMAGQTGQNPFSGSQDNPAAALEVMHEYIPRAYGEDWLAVGVRFTSFEIIQSFALLTAAFGTRFEVALLGLSAVTVPPLAPDPIGFAELALEVSFSPDDGLLAVSAGLTPESYILSKSCHLTGGFAFYIWFKDNADGASAGEFVVTLGGYHPDFSKPSYYPAEPRLGVNWKVSSNLIVKGGFYFALTPSAVMAGGFLEATWHSGDLKAWFNADANFLLSWKPFHYEADMNLSLGASYKVNLLEAVS